MNIEFCLVFNSDHWFQRRRRLKFLIRYRKIKELDMLNGGHVFQRFKVILDIISESHTMTIWVILVSGFRRRFLPASL